MKNNYFFLVFVFFYFQLNAQSKCSSAEPDLNYAYSLVKSAYDSNNLTHLKYYSKRSFDAFERAQNKLEGCNCERANNFALEGSQLLSKLENSTTFEDGRFYVKRAREIAQKAIHELENCSKLTYEDEALVELEFERQKLEEQQKQLKQKETKIQQLLADKEERELRIKKEKLIYASQQVLSSNINTYNEMLLANECEGSVSKLSVNNKNLLSKDLTEIKLYYLNTIKKATLNYLSIVIKPVHNRI